MQNPFKKRYNAVTKNCATKMEGIASVRDGSTGEYRKGYHTFLINGETQKYFVMIQ